MRLLIEEALEREPVIVEKRLSPTGSFYTHTDLKFKGEEYCAIPIIRSGDSMLHELFELLPGVTVGKVLI